MVGLGRYLTQGDSQTSVAHICELNKLKLRETIVSITRGEKGVTKKDFVASSKNQQNPATKCDWGPSGRKGGDFRREGKKQFTLEANQGGLCNPFQPSMLNTKPTQMDKIPASWQRKKKKTWI